MADRRGREGGRPRGWPPGERAGEKADLPSRIVLVGFMGAGKTTVGALLARALDYSFVDLDLEVERLAGRAVPDLFRSGGEAAFRALEERATEAADDVWPAVIAAGGGWMARSELRDRWPDAVRVWLRVSPEEALARLGEALSSRPMLDPADPIRAARDLLRARESAYGLAELAVDTVGRTPAEVAAAIRQRLVSGR